MNTNLPQGGVMVGGGAPPEAVRPEDPWAVSSKPRERKIEVGGKITFSSGKNKN
jgi:hypothetical protein